MFTYPSNTVINNQQLSFFCLQLISVINVYIFSYAVKLTFFLHYKVLQMHFSAIPTH